METLAFAIVFIFILWLIDKHNLWRGFFKIIGALVSLAVLGAICLFGWIKYDKYRTEKRQAAEAALHERRVQNCLTRNGITNPDVFDKTACDEDPTVKVACWSKPDETGLQ